MIAHEKTDRRMLSNLIRKGMIVFAGNRQLKIYGRLNCASGKKMKEKNRVFFKSEMEAIDSGFRPCGHCMNREFQQWKS
jgi:methylphosphotriester-DNA--protein-cysteine methyltransferase